MPLKAVSVYLVGAGPGDPGLLTVAGSAVLRRAAVVVYDYLASARLLRECRGDVELIYVGKSGRAHTRTQEEINELLVAKARELGGRGKGGGERDETFRENIIVRLKGGDPFVFGRGGEEGEFLRARGVPFVVIPGITSGIAGPAYAGIAVTHRDLASTVTLVTGHEREDAGGEGGEARVDYGALAKLGGTLVFYMGVKALPQIVERLMGGGMGAGTPAAVIQWATKAAQRTVTGTLETIVERVKSAGITAPAITVVGRVVGLRETLDWFERRPLFGRRVLVTRTRQQASELSAQLAELGAEVVEAATIELAEPESWETVDAALRGLKAYDWVVFTSTNGVRAAWERMRGLGLDARAFGARVAAVGPATAEALLGIGVAADVIPEKFVGEELAAAVGARAGELAGRRVLLLRADIARPALREALSAAGARVEDVAIYRTVRPAGLGREVTEALEKGATVGAGERAGERGGGFDWITFTSASTARNLYELLPTELRAVVGGVKKISIGPVTTAALRELGWAPAVEARTHDIAGMVAGLVEAAGGRGVEVMRGS